MTASDFLTTASENSHRLGENLTNQLGKAVSVVFTGAADPADVASASSECLALTGNSDSARAQLWIPPTAAKAILDSESDSPTELAESLSNTAGQVMPSIFEVIDIDAQNSVLSINLPGEYDSDISGSSVLAANISIDDVSFSSYLVVDFSAATGDQLNPALDLADFGDAPAAQGTVAAGLGLLADVEVDVTVELGRRRLPINELLKLTRGSIIELEKLVGEPLEVYINDRLIADGEAVVIDEQFGIRISNIIPSAQRGT